MCLGYHRDEEDIEPLSKYPHCERHMEENAEAILYPLLHLTLD